LAPLGWSIFVNWLWNPVIVLSRNAMLLLWLDV
jgi:hypothetical protein